jgi:hypothetical protein
MYQRTLYSPEKGALESICERPPWWLSGDGKFVEHAKGLKQ